MILAQTYDFDLRGNNPVSFTSTGTINTYPLKILSVYTAADKFGYEFHGNAKNYLKIEVSGTALSTFQLASPSTVVLWLYVLNQNELQHIYCKSLIINKYHRPKFCVFIKDGYYWGELFHQQLQTDTPVDSGWTMLAIQLQDTTESYAGNIKTQMRIIAYNGRWRHYTDPVLFDLQYTDDDNYMTYFGGRPIYNLTTNREEINQGFNGYMIQLKLFNSVQTLAQLDSFMSCMFQFQIIKLQIDYCMANSNYESCDLCRAQDSNQCLVYDDLTTPSQLLVAKYSFDNYQDAATNKQIIKDYGPSASYHLQRGIDSTSKDDRDPSRTVYYGLYFVKNSYLKMMKTLDLDKDFTFDFYLRMDQPIADDEYYIFTKSGQHYYGFSLAQNNSAYFFINNTNNKQFCKTWFTNFIDPLQDLKEWLYISVSASEFSDYSTNVCVYKRGWSVTAQCQVLLCQMNKHSQSQSWYIGGKSFTGAIRTMYIWNYAKALNVMNYSPLIGLISEDLEQSVETKGDCEAFNPNNDKIFLGYCALCDKYNGMANQGKMCFSPCDFNKYDEMCTEKCRNDLCEICLGGSVTDCQVCKTGAEIDSTSYQCKCTYSDYYLASDSQSCLQCHQSCYGCDGSNYTNCYACESGYIPVTDKDLCGTGLQYQQLLVQVQFYVNLNLDCGAGKYSIDGYTCTDMVFASIENLAIDMSSLKIKFTRPLTHSLDYEDLSSKFQIIITGPRESYIISYSLDENSFMKAKYSKIVTFTLGVQSTLYGIEKVKIIFSDLPLFKDADGIPFGGPGNLEIQTYSFSFLSVDDKQTTQQAGGLAQQSSMISLAVSLVIQVVAGGSVEALFCLSYMMQICSILPLMNLYFPSNTIQMFKNLAFVNVNNEFLSGLFKAFFYTDSDFSDQEPLNDNFNNVGFGSKNMFMNSPDQLFMWVLLIGVYPFIVFAKYMFSHLGPICKTFIEIENSFHFNGIIKTFQQIYLTMLIVSLVDVFYTSPVNSADKMSFYGSYIFIAISLFLIVFSVVFVIIQRHFLSHKRFQHTWGALILNGEIKLKKPYHYLYLWTFLVRRAVLAISLVVAKDYPRAQLMVYIGSSSFILLWHLILQPYESNMLNFFNIFNELVLLLCGCIMILFLDAAMPEKEANLYGYLMITIVVLAIIINWAVILPSKVIEGIESVKLMIRHRDDKIRYQIEKKYLMFESDFDQTGDLIIQQRITDFRAKSRANQRDRLRINNDANNNNLGFQNNLLGFNNLNQFDDTNENMSQSMIGKDYFPIIRIEDDMYQFKGELNPIREAMILDEQYQDQVKNGRLPYMDPKMKKKKPTFRDQKSGQLVYDHLRPVSHQIVIQQKASEEISILRKNLDRSQIKNEILEDQNDKYDKEILEINDNYNARVNVLQSIDAIDINDLQNQRGISQLQSANYLNYNDMRPDPTNSRSAFSNHRQNLGYKDIREVPQFQLNEFGHDSNNRQRDQNVFQSQKIQIPQYANQDYDINDHGYAYDANKIDLNLTDYIKQRGEMHLNVEQPQNIILSNLQNLNNFDPQQQKNEQNIKIYDMF
ncbi:UNKNOWN [Stylonychia lemnae]|uniref:Cadg multi-domain protein n=1 Tax=Stylonychia lemnae TaxID=5949 RepID=A0A078B9I0_STYLE|nr:UNKNOWN [Stylonychia lemnae]|eukprot:CDW91190.1 UNKNOWN [Stylonychia lemnae]